MLPGRSGRGVADWSEGLLESYAGKRVLVTGHTGFKGSWLCWMLSRAGAQVAGYALEPPTQPNLYEVCGLGSSMQSYIGDIRDCDALKGIFDAFQPEFIFHLAAQPIVRDSYDDPRYTFETNVMGTVNVLECTRQSQSAKSFLNVTTDKVYFNADAPDHAFAEDEPLDGHDPYSNSKSCSELVTHSYARSFFGTQDAARISTARAGNVIGGGDFAPHRIVADCVRCTIAKRPIEVRNPHSTRPFQHVLEPLFAYLLIVRRQLDDASVAGWYNVGPDACDCASAGELADMWCDAWGENASWIDASAPADVPEAKHEATFLQLDNGKLKRAFGWAPRWSIHKAVEATAQWTRVWQDGGDIGACMDAQIDEYLRAC